jgi:phosphoadenosine phosphosulfate reductase
MRLKMVAPPVQEEAALVARAATLNARCAHSSALEIIAEASNTFGLRLAATSSFGAESVVLLHLISQVKPDLPIVFLNTLRHFSETLAYKDELVALLGLTNVIEARPDPDRMRFEDPKLDLSKRNPDQCCRSRKKLPMLDALNGFDAYLTGRKRSQTEDRADLQVFEVQDQWIKVNPLANWSKAELDDHIDGHGLPRHPLEPWGYLSVGCEPCTSPVAVGSNPRAGRWAGMAKTECGIHFAEEVQLDWAC